MNVKKQKSAVWNFFKLIDKNTTQCQLCKAKLKYTGGSTSSMHSHLKDIHKKNPNASSVKDSRQVSLIEMQQSRKKLGPDAYNKLNRALALASAVDLRPISIAAGRGFRSFCHLLNSDYKVPSTTTVKKHLMLIYQEEKERVIKQLDGQVFSSIYSHQ